MTAEFKETPVYFMERENRFDTREAASGRPDLTRKQMEDRDRWLNHHRDIDRDLRLNPQLVNDDNYLDKHKDFRQFLDKNPEVRQQFVYQSSATTTSAAATTGAARTDVNRQGQDDRLTTKERQDRDQFLDKHRDIARDLRNEPTLAADKDYLNYHKDLRSFLDKNPNLREGMTKPASDQPAASKPNSAAKPHTAQNKAPGNPQQKGPVAPQLLH